MAVRRELNGTGCLTQPSRISSCSNWPQSIQQKSFTTRPCSVSRPFSTILPPSLKINRKEIPPLLAPSTDCYLPNRGHDRPNRMLIYYGGGVASCSHCCVRPKSVGGCQYKPWKAHIGWGNKNRISCRPR